MGINFRAKMCFEKRHSCQTKIIFERYIWRFQGMPINRIANFINVSDNMSVVFYLVNCVIAVEGFAIGYPINAINTIAIKPPELINLL